MSGRGNAELLAFNLDLLEKVILDRLATPGLARPRTARNEFLRGDLEKALKYVAVARAELAKCPEGAPLAFACMGAQLARVQFDLSLALSAEQGRRDGRGAQAEAERALWEQWQQIASGLPRGKTKTWAARKVREELHKRGIVPLPAEKTISARIVY